MSFTPTPEATEWYLEIPAEVQAQCWEASRNQAIESSQWNAYLNRLCLNAVLGWIQDDGLAAAVWLGLAKLPAVWEFVNGTVLTIGAERWVLIPTESIEDDLEVPQEWVDIPSWAGDYYLGVQVRPDGESLRVWGYTTHRELKERGAFDADDRLYCLDGSAMIQDMDSLAVVRSRWTQAQTKVEVPALSEVPATQAANLVQRLGNRSVRFPRLAVPFALWGALLESDAGRQGLYQQRLGQGSGETAITRLGDWLSGAMSDLWQGLDDLVNPPEALAGWRGEANDVRYRQLLTFNVNKVRTLTFGSQGETQVAVIMGVSALNEVERSIGLQVQAVGDRIPEEIQVRLLNAEGGEEGQARATRTENISLQFDGRSGEQFTVEVCCGAQCMTETFEV
jgi:Protein of unknown function (DUF1822)